MKAPLCFILVAGIRDTMMKISFVQKANRHIDSLTGHKHGISFTADTVIESGIDIRTGYNGPERFETYFNFAVYPPSFSIMIEYPDTGELITIAE